MNFNELKPRAWQIQAIGECVKHAVIDKGKDFLLVATPGAGKTMASLMCASRLLEVLGIQRVLIVCPSVALRTQWVRKSVEVGINAKALLTRTSDLVQEPLPFGVQAIVMTYQQVIQMPGEIADWIASAPTMVILDEVHHCGEKKDWGDGVRQAFDGARYRMLLSGTPFREDDCPIPYVFYNPESRTSVANTTYGYSAAISERVCRPVELPWLDGLHEWRRGEVQSAASFEDSIRKRDHGARLKAAVDPDTEGCRELLTLANDKLTEIRAQGGYHETAGALAVGYNTEHVERLAAVLREISGEDPVVVTQEVPRASELIESFDNGTHRWLVAINMVSEGVDIPRLRVGAYCSIVRTSLRFRQTVGRLVRVQRAAEAERAYMFIPGDPDLKKWALEIDKERRHALGEELSRPARELMGRSRRSNVVVIGSEAEQRGIIFGNRDIPPVWIEKARTFKRRDPAHYSRMSDADVARILMDMAEMTESAA